MRPQFGAAVMLAAAMAASPPIARAAPETMTGPPEPGLPESMPLPPIPPTHPPRDVAAPIPDATLTEPKAPGSEGPQWQPTLNERAPTLPGGDPVPGSLYRSEQEQKRQFIPNPGIRLVVPIQ